MRSALSVVGNGNIRAKVTQASRSERHRDRACRTDRKARPTCTGLGKREFDGNPSNVQGRRTGVAQSYCFIAGGSDLLVAERNAGE